MASTCVICSTPFLPKPNTTGKYCSLTCASRSRAKGATRRVNEENYLKTPTFCKGCDKILPYQKVLNKAVFCGSSCSATFHNQQRGRSTKLCDCCNTPFVYSNKSQRYCSRKCFGIIKKNITTVRKFEKGLIDRRPTMKRILLDRHGHKCQDSRCGIEMWHDQPVPLELDHIDGNAGNNMPDNVRLLCPNCHAMTPTSRGRNLGNGRKSRGIRVG